MDHSQQNTTADFESLRIYQFTGKRLVFKAGYITEGMAYYRNVDLFQMRKENTNLGNDSAYGETGSDVKRILHLPWIYNELEYSSKQRTAWFNQLVKARKQYNQYLGRYGITRNINARYWRYTSSGTKVRKPYYNDLKKIYSTAGSFKKIFFGYNYAKEFSVKRKWVYQV